MLKNKAATYCQKISRNVVIAILLAIFTPIFGPIAAVSANPPTPPAFPSFTSISYGDLNASTTVHLYFDDSANPFDQNTSQPTWSIDYSLDSGATWITPTDQEYSYMHCYGPDYVTRSMTVCWFDILQAGDYSVMLRYGNYLASTDPSYSAGTPSEEIQFHSVSYTREDFLISNVQTQPIDGGAIITFNPPAVTQYTTFRNVNFAYSLAGGAADTTPASWHYGDSETKTVTNQPNQSWEISGLTNYNNTNYIVFGYYIPGENRWLDFATYNDNEVTFQSYYIYAAPSEPPTITSVTPITYSSFSIDFDAPVTSATVSGYKYSTDDGATWSPADSVSPFTISTQSSGSSLIAGSTYPILMRAIYHDINGDYDGLVSNQIGATLPSRSAPLTILSPLQGETFTGVVGQNLNINTSTSGGSSPVVFSALGGLLPPGTSINTATGTISGTPTTPGLFPSWITATDAFGDTSTVLISVSIPQPSALPPDRYTWHFYEQSQIGFTSVASSANGRNLAAASDGVIHLSHDYGESWETATATNGPTWISVATNAEGSQLVSLDTQHNVWISRDFGVTWGYNNNLPPYDPYYDCSHTKVTSSASGQYLSVLCNLELRVSDDFGITWSTRSFLPGEGDAIFASNSGRYYAIFRSNELLLSSDSGTTFSDITPPDSGELRSFVFSGDETKIYAGDVLGKIYFSSNFGSTWDSVTANFTDFGWGIPGAVSLTSNFDGSILSAVVNYSTGGAEFFSSVDAGLTWVDLPQGPPSESLQFSAASADGFQVMMSSSDQGVWVGPYVNHVASLASGNIKGVSVSDFGTPARLIADTQAGHIVLGGMVGASSLLTSQFNPSVSVASIGRVVKYAAGTLLPTAGNFSTDEPFDHQIISEGDYFIIKVVAQDLSAMYYRINASIDVAQSLHLNIKPTFGPTVIGQSETQSVTVTGLSTPFFNPAVYDWRISSANSDFSILDASNCGGGVGGPGVEFAEGDTCQILIKYTPSSSGPSTAKLETRYEWQNGNGLSSGSLSEYLYLQGSGITPPTRPSLPLIWESQTVVMNQAWRDIASSAEGVHMAAVYGGGSVYTSSDSGKTWVERTGSGQRNWTAITSSSDGMRLAAVAYGGNIYTSNDGGTTWIEREAPISPEFNNGQNPYGSYNKAWKDIASSADGMKLVIVDNGDGDGGDIYTSTDGGASWEDRSSQSGQGSLSWKNWASVASSYNGLHIAAIASDSNYIYLSNDQGATWTSSTGIDGPAGLSRVVSNSDGSRVVVITPTTDQTYNYISPGNSFTIYTSSDFAQNWNYLGPDVQDRWRSISTNLDGSHIAALSDGGYIYLSTDFGTTWESMTAAGQRDWTTIAMSTDGLLLTAGTASGEIWTYRSVPVVNSQPVSQPAPVFAQQSKIDSISPSVLESMKSTKIVITGTFIEEIQSVLIDGKPLSSGSWVQTLKTLTVTFTGRTSGKYTIQLFNGSTPLLADQYLTVEEAVKPAESVVTPAPVKTPKPAAAPTTRPSPAAATEAVKPLKSTLVNRVYFDMGSAVVTKSNLITLRALAAQIAGLGKKITITATGYAQPTPKGASLDAALSKRRAAAVAKLLAEFGVNTRVNYLGAGRALKNVPSSRYVEIVAANR